MVQEVVRAIRKAGAKVDETCGIHVHVGLGEHTPKTLRNLVNIVNAKEALLTQALGISPERRGRWCRPVDQDFLARLNREKPKTMEGFAALWYGTDSWQYHAGRHYDDSRYHLLNLHASFSTERPAHTIEFRAFNATLHAGEIKSYIQLCLAISHQALTASSASPRRPVTDNPKYTFHFRTVRVVARARCSGMTKPDICHASSRSASDLHRLLRLGFIGDEFETARLHLTKKLDGNGAWRSGH